MLMYSTADDEIPTKRHQVLARLGPPLRGLIYKYLNIRGVLLLVRAEMINQIPAGVPNNVASDRLL